MTILPGLMMAFTKRAPGAPADYFSWEVAGLSWLRQADGADVVDVLEVGREHLTLERLEQRSPTPDQVERFGVDLFRTHSAGAPSFGCGPPGWVGDGWIGRAPLSLGNFNAWGEAFAEVRVLPFARMASASGDLSPTALRDIEAVCQRLRDGEFDDGRPPARIHGDLWAGNVMTTAAGCVLIDPAAQGGHGETDLAMLALFGFPMLTRVQMTYAEAAGLDEAWPERIALHQLHPLLVHAVLFGGGYGEQAAMAAAHYR